MVSNLLKKDLKTSIKMLHLKGSQEVPCQTIHYLGLGIVRIIKKRRNQDLRKRKKISGKRLAWTLFFTAAFAIFVALAGYLFIMVSGERILQANFDKMSVNETSKVYDRNGEEISELSIEKRDPVDEEDIPQILKDAFIATEDKRFYEHNGVDLWAIGRAAVTDIMARSLVEGGSTISQQLAKNVFLTRDKTFFRKATEMSIALAIERNYSKDEILTMYLNRTWFGYQNYGIQTASEFYFGKSDLNELELWEVATLAAIPKGPSAYNPAGNPNDSKERRGVVLQLMYDQGYISKEEMDEAKAWITLMTPGRGEEIRCLCRLRAERGGACNRQNDGRSEHRWL